jgi:formylglycine-generating enzyme required for sulfatase activity
MDVTWILLEGGTCPVGDRARPVAVGTLWWSAIPITRGQLGVGAAEPRLPATGLTFDEAGAIAAELGGRLPTGQEWEWAAAGAGRRRYPWGGDDWAPERANLRPAGHGRVLPAGAHPAGATPDGLLDMAGNVWEWTASRWLHGDGAGLRGGSYNSLPLYARCTFLNAAPRWLRSPGIGFRVVCEP